MGGLTVKQDKFVKAYLLNGGNATQAAIEAGYSERTANEQGAQNLAKLSIKEAIAEHQKKVEENFIMSKTEKLQMLEKIVNATAIEDAEKGILNPQAAIAAIKEHNLMQGHNAPSKLDHLSSDGSMTPTKIVREVVDATKH